MTAFDNETLRQAVGWGRPYLERRHAELMAAAKKAEQALSHACNPPPDWDDDTRKSDAALFGDALDQIRNCIEMSGKPL